MGQDDDADCVEHVWVLTEIGARENRLDTTSVCSRCETVRYEPADDLERPPLGPA